jgi:DNA-binding transcriptional LysR family regulator
MKREAWWSRPGLSFERLRAFVAFADHGSIARAAAGDPTRQSQMSRQIADLQRFFGKALVERRGRGLALTEAGAQLAALARTLFDDLEQVAAPADHEKTHLTLGAGDSLLQWWIVPRLVPEMDAVMSLVALPSEESVRRLEDARLDIGIVRADMVSKRLEVRPLATIRYAVFAPKKLARGARTMREVLDRVPLALQQSEPEINERLRRVVGRDVDVALACETFPQAARAVRSGRHASLLPVVARRDLPASDFVEIGEDALQRLALRVVLAHHPRLRRKRHAPAIVERLVRALV